MDRHKSVARKQVVNRNAGDARVGVNVAGDQSQCAGNGANEIPGFTDADLVAAMNEAQAIDTVPPGWVTVAEIANRLNALRGLNPTSGHARKTAQALVEGKPCRVFRVQNGRRGVYPIRHYLMKGQA